MIAWTLGLCACRRNSQVALKHTIWLLLDWGSCLIVILQTHPSKKIWISRLGTKRRVLIAATMCSHVFTCSTCGILKDLVLYVSILSVSPKSWNSQIRFPMINNEIDIGNLGYIQWLYLRLHSWFLQVPFWYKTGPDYKWKWTLFVCLWIVCGFVCGYMIIGLV